MEPLRHDRLPPILDRGFFERPVTEVARDLLGCYLVRGNGTGVVGGRIVETEAYGAPGDPGSHADRAPNGRARIMFGPAGVAYVYFTYGMHHCMNAVTGREGDAGAVLLRAIEPVWGTKRMRRGAPLTLADRLLGSGPGRLCRALGIDRHYNGTDLLSGPVRILRGPRFPQDAPTGAPSNEVLNGTRVGLSVDDGRAWRFWVPSASVSRPPRSPALGTRS